MGAMAGLAAILAMQSLAGVSTPDVDALEALWPGVRDSTEQVFIGADASVSVWGDSERRIRTVIARLNAPQLGTHVLYLEEFPHDDPQNIRRELILQLQPLEAGSGVRVLVYDFREPSRWIHLDHRPARLGQLSESDLTRMPGCDLVLRREGDQFTGGTSGRACLEQGAKPSRYVDYRMVVGEDIYWYRRRILRRANDELEEEVFGYNWFELSDARLFTCRVDWSASGKRSERRLLAKLDLQDQGGRARFATPDGRRLEIALHSDDWPFMPDRDALILILQDSARSAPLASAWTEIDAQDIAIDLGWIKIECGSVVPDNDELWASLTSRLLPGLPQLPVESPMP